jgi:hypothetical protein
MLDQLRAAGSAAEPSAYIELMVQIQVLDLKPAPRLEPIEDKGNEQVKHRKHRMEDAPIPSHVAKPARTEFSGMTGSNTGS